jgi:hypothetical protein
MSESHSSSRRWKARRAQNERAARRGMCSTNHKATRGARTASNIDTVTVGRNARVMRSRAFLRSRSKYRSITYLRVCLCVGTCVRSMQTGSLTGTQRE